ncbi:MAG: hypothetical protein ABI566_03555 [Pseudolysinimonas sp.]
MESPLQLLAAAEYAASRGRAVDVALRVGPQLAETAQRLIEMRALFGTVQPYFGIPWGMLASHRSWLVGDGFSGQFQTAMSTIGARTVTLLDDGMMTLPLARSLTGTRVYARPGHPTSRRRTALASLTRDRLLALAARESLSFFTAFAGHESLGTLGAHGIAVEENTFAWLRRTGTPVPLPADSVVLGSAAVTDGSLSTADYLAWVRSVTRHADSTVAYLPHRREHPDLLAAVAGLPHMAVVRTGLPVELALAGGDRAMRIATLPSTAAITLACVLAGTGSTITTQELREPVR